MAGLNGQYARHRQILLGVGALGLTTFVATLALSPQRAWSNLLLGNFYFVSLALFGAVFVALNYVFSSGWGVVFRRVPEAMSAYLPLGAAVMLVLFLFGLSALYVWSRPEAVASNPYLQQKAVYLNAPFFFVRAALAFAVWIAFSRLLRRHSVQQDVDGDLAHTRKNQKLSAAFLVLVGLTFIFFSFDWIMSLEPKWYSTIFPVYVFSGLFLGGTAAMTMLVIQFQEKGLLSGITSHHRHELGRVLCAASTFWAYIWFSQYMLIYYTNIPEEAIYFANRLTGGGRLLFLLNPVLNWFVPLVILIPARARRSSGWLLRVCGIVLIARWLDLYLMIVPALGSPLQLGLPEVLIPLGFLPLFVLPVIASFRRAAPLPRRDPYLVESAHLHV
ncbi:MAG: hypothetical protein HY320_03035 [Armatimonadetes bacterium]|nr:hypothetical protein [Armatimonadota bacterium]